MKTYKCLFLALSTYCLATLPMVAEEILDGEISQEESALLIEDLGSEEVPAGKALTAQEEEEQKQQSFEEKAPITLPMMPPEKIEEQKPMVKLAPRHHFCVIALNSEDHQVQLSGGSRWNVKGTTEEDGNLHDAYSEWQTGDIIRIDAYFGKEGRPSEGFYELKNITRHSSLVATLDTETEQVLALNITEIDHNGYFIKTSDGADWTISWASSWVSQYWKKGERLLVSRSTLGNRYLLINLDRQSWVNGELTQWKN
jgi:hypothetical protein